MFDSNCDGFIKYGELIYYSHLIPIGISLILIFFANIKSNFLLLSKVFTLFLISFNAWLLLDTFAWVSTNTYIITISWIPLDLTCLLFYIFALYFYKVYTTKNDMNGRNKILLLIALIPALVITLTGNSITGFDINLCEALNNDLLTIYKFIIEILVILYIIQDTIRININGSLCNRVHVNIISISLIIFLTIFSFTDFISSETGIYEISLYSLLISPAFLFIITISISNFKIFREDLISSLPIGYILITISIIQTIIQNNNLGGFLPIYTITISIMFGLLLISTSRKEHSHLQKIASLALSLKNLNDNLSEKVAEQTSEIRKAYETEKKALRDLEKLTDTKDNFISIAQHNIRIPITNIKNSISLFLKNPKQSNSNDVDLLKKTLLSVKYLEDIADDFKDISKMKVGSQILNLSICNTRQMIEGVFDEFKIDISNMDIKISYPTDSDAWPDLKIDQKKIREVFIIIIENAIKYNNKGGYIKVDTKTIDNVFYIEIKNSGIGINNEEIKNINEKSFYRSKRSKDINPTGMGIGLSLAKNIIEAHHGDLSIESDGDSLGAQITIRIPTNFIALL